MRRLHWTLLWAAWPLAAFADEPAKPNSLTPREIADGWLLLFDGETTFGWDVKGPAAVAGGALVLGGDQETNVAMDYGYFEASWERRWEGKARPRCVITATPPNGSRATAELGLGFTERNGRIDWTTERWKIEAAPNTLVENSLQSRGDGPGMAFEQTTRFQPGCRIRVDLTVPAGTKLFLRNVKLRPTGLNPIFNGKDLTGWKEYAGKASQFAVTPEGWLSLTNGPGDLQTEGQWDDFVLQLECRTNGDRLNSGVFFRCRPGEYQQGYEAQIHNLFTAEPAKEYTLEDYDPATHELTGRRKEKFAAVDYGTGGIYRRQPARRQAARDREWFTMTVAARGNRFRVWVNGLAVTDWTDHRPPADNPREGCRLEKGAVSLQGHDPTTDLNFRNIGIVGLPRAGGS
jgi:hypothetical protein